MIKILSPVALLLLIGCAQPKGDFGDPIQKTEITPIEAILKDPQSFEGKTVKVSGEITQECPHGGWFYLKSGNPEIYVNLHPTNFAIPQAVGQTAIAEGTVKKDGTKIEIVGTGVKLP